MTKPPKYLMPRALLILLAMTSLVVLDSRSPRGCGDGRLLSVAIVKTSTHCDALIQVSSGYVNCNASEANKFFHKSIMVNQRRVGRTGRA